MRRRELREESDRPRARPARQGDGELQPRRASGVAVKWTTKLLRTWRLRFLRRDRDGQASRREEELEEDLGRNDYAPFGAIVLSAPWPLMKVMASGRVRIFSSIERISVAYCRQEGRCGDRTLENHVATRQNCKGSFDEDHAAGGMSRTMAHVEPRFAELHRIAFVSQVGRDVARGEAEAARRRLQRIEQELVARVRASMVTPRIRAIRRRRRMVGMACVRRFFRPWRRSARWRGGSAARRRRIDHGRHFRRLTDENGAILLERRNRDNGDLDLRHETPQSAP